MNTEVPKGLHPQVLAAAFDRPWHKMPQPAEAQPMTPDLVRERGPRRHGVLPLDEGPEPPADAITRPRAASHPHINRTGSA